MLKWALSFFKLLQTTSNFDIEKAYLMNKTVNALLMHVAVDDTHIGLPAILIPVETFNSNCSVKSAQAKQLISTEIVYIKKYKSRIHDQYNECQDNPI
jgi:hypothetical protein